MSFDDDVICCPLCHSPMYWELLPMISNLICTKCPERVRYHQTIERWVVGGVSYTQDEVERLVKLKAFL
jgi:hypothetical protein